MNAKWTDGNRLLGALAAVVAAGSLFVGSAEAGDAEPSNVGPQMETMLRADWTAQDRRFTSNRGKPSNAGAPVAVTTREDASGGCDGVKNGRWGFHTASKAPDPWWQVDLGADVRLDRIVVFNRTDSGCAPRTANIRILLAKAGALDEFTEIYRHDGTTFFGVKENKPLVVSLADENVTGRIVRLHVPGPCSLALDEVEVFAADATDKNIALGKPADQDSVSQYSHPGTLGEPTALAAVAGCEFSLAHTADVVRRAETLAARLAPNADPARLQPIRERLGTLKTRLTEHTAAAEQPDADVRLELYFEAKRLARKIAFANPLLDFDKLLFIKRHDPTGPYHMCDQYYGCNAIAGGGVFVLADPFGDDPRLVNLLADAPVANGRLAGQIIDGGGFVSPEVSYDGRTVLFAHSQCKAPETYRWGPEISYHLFSINADGSGLRQLTDGDADDFDPCFLPNGRVAFVSLRRGGYLRCGRHCPVYTLHSMRPDGSDVVRLSHHETHEWHPSVDNNGMIVYTRWDYVDRDTNVAHHIWSCFPDGRDPRSFHGNYPVRREDRPWMEMSIRAVPNSPKYVATAAAHHGHAFGSLVLIDPRGEDDAAMSQLERLTPEVPFPEAGGKGNIRERQVYATAWPLSEDDYLCSYDPAAKNHALYWIDRFGNKELIYRDASIPCLSPIPLRPRPMPPAIPDRVVRAKPDAPAADPLPSATVAVMNVYDSDFPWPGGTKIDALRIIQVLPKTTPPPNVPRIGVADQTNARAVLGTVPVESDGSVHFTAPAGKAIYFQALDGNGLAVQSMRSATYLQPGETLTCVVLL